MNLGLGSKMHQLRECQELSRVYDPDAGGVTLPLNWGDLIPSDVNRVVASERFMMMHFLCGSFHSWQHSCGFPPNCGNMMNSVIQLHNI